jgi:AraC family transcriptional regulator
MDATSTSFDACEPYFATREQLDTYASIGVKPLGRTQLGLAHFRRDEPGLGYTRPNAIDQSVLVTINLRPLQQRGEMWRDDHAFWRGPLARGDLVALDQRVEWSSVVLEPFEMVQLFVPMQALDALADEVDAKPIETLYCPVTAPQRDPVMLSLVSALLPLIPRAERLDALFAEHVFHAMLVHLAKRYGGLTLDTRPGVGLAAWQLRRVRDAMLSNVANDVSLSELARMCGLSATQFGRAFKISTGQPPYRWLVLQRIQLAKQLLASSGQSIGEIALACGFSDQSHLTHVFRRVVGVTPGAWRREHRR